MKRIWENNHNKISLVTQPNLITKMKFCETVIWLWRIFDMMEKQKHSIIMWVINIWELILKKKVDNNWKPLKTNGKNIEKFPRINKY